MSSVRKIVLSFLTVLLVVVGASSTMASAVPVEQHAVAATVDSAYAGQKLGIIGHSFTSANGADNGSVTYQDKDSYEVDTTGPTNLCYRSKHAASVQVAEQLGMSYVFAACAGAEPEHLYRTPQYDEGVQTDWLTPDMTTVVMGTRGNPEFGAAIQQLVDPTRDPGMHCSFVEHALPGNCSLEANLLQWAIDSYASREWEEQEIYDAVRARAPHAQLYSMGIPPVVPQPGQDISVCGWFLSQYEVTSLAWLVDSLNAMLRATAERNGAIFVDFSRPDSPWVQGRHDLCAPSDAWLWGPRLLIPPRDEALLSPDMWMTAAFHPTIAANDAMTQVLLWTMLENAS